MATAGMQQSGLSESAAAVDAMQKHGMVVEPVTPAMQKEWEQYVTGTIWPKMRGTMVPADTFDEVMRLVAEYRKQPGHSQ